VSGLAKFPLDWMVREAVAFGLRIHTAIRNHIVLGRPRAGARTMFVKPDPAGKLHDSLTPGWKPLEWLPKTANWREWPRREFGGMYLPRAEPRMITNDDVKPIIHSSVLARMSLVSDYRPENFPADFNVEP
jgi:hypothetical protein